MLLHAILLLLGSLAVADGLAPCSRSGMEGGFLRVYPPTSSFTCLNANNEIEYKGQRFKQLDCDNGKWTHEGKPLVPHPEGDLSYVCVCTKDCPKNISCKVHAYERIRNAAWDLTDKKIVTTNKTHTTFACSVEGNVIKYGGNHFDSINCVNGEWKHGIEQVDPSLNPGDELTVKCVKNPNEPVYYSYCLSRDFNGDVSYHHGQTITCKMNDRILYAQQYFDVLQCDNGEWKHGNESLKPPVRTGQTLLSTCVTAHRDCFFHDSHSDWEQTLSHGQTFQCRENQQILYALQFFNAFQCDNGEWKHGNEPLNPPVPAGQLLIATCFSGQPYVPGVTADCWEFRANEPYPRIVKNTNLIYCTANWQIEYAGKHFKVLQCDNGEWKHEKQLLNPPVRAGQPIYYGCVPLTPQYPVVPITSEPAPTATTKQAPATSKTTPMKPNPVTDPEQDMTTTLDPTATTVEENWMTESGESTESDLAEESQQVSTTTIICCVIGGLVLIGLAMAALLCYKNAKNRAENSESGDEKTRKNYEMSDSNMDEV